MRPFRPFLDQSHFESSLGMPLCKQARGDHMLISLSRSPAVSPRVYPILYFSCSFKKQISLYQTSKQKRNATLMSKHTPTGPFQQGSFGYHFEILSMVPNPP